MLDIDQRCNKPKALAAQWRLLRHGHSVLAFNNLHKRLHELADLRLDDQDDAPSISMPGPITQYTPHTVIKCTATMTTPYGHMSADLRHAVDDIVDGRDVAQQEEREGSDPSHVLQEWAGIVTCVLEQLPPDSSVVECWALMGVSFNNQWRAQAITRMDRDPNVFDQLCVVLPDWFAIVDGLAEAHRKRPLSKASR